MRLLNNSNLNNCCRLYCLLLFGLKGLPLDPYVILLWRKLNINDFQLISSHLDFVKAFCDEFIKYTILIPVFNYLWQQARLRFISCIGLQIKLVNLWICSSLNLFFLKKKKESCLNKMCVVQFHFRFSIYND